MKKLLLISLMVILMSQAVFAESLDEVYIDLIFDKFSTYDDETKLQRSEELKVFMEDENRLDLLYTIITATKADAMAEYGITSADVRRNIDALKTWSAVDRFALVEAGASENRSVVNALNAKYDEADPVSPPPVTPPVTPPPTITPPIIGLPDEEVPLGTISLYGMLKARGFIHELVAVDPSKAGKVFEDTSKHWSKPHVTYLAERGIISGRSDTVFAPNAPIKKSEIIALIMKLIIVDVERLPMYTGDIPDIEMGKWYDDALQKAFTLGLIDPDKSGLMDPSHYSSREEVVDVLIRTLRALEIDIAPELMVYKGDFKDIDQVKPELQESMTIAINLGFISGMGDGRIAPEEEITRGQIAVVVKKLYLYIMNEVEASLSLEE